MVARKSSHLNSCLKFFIKFYKNPSIAYFLYIFSARYNYCNFKKIKMLKIRPLLIFIVNFIGNYFIVSLEN